MLIRKSGVLEKWGPRVYDNLWGRTTTTTTTTTTHTDNYYTDTTRNRTLVPANPVKEYNTVPDREIRRKF